MGQHGAQASWPWCGPGEASLTLALPVSGSRRQRQCLWCWSNKLCWTWSWPTYNITGMHRRPGQCWGSWVWKVGHAEGRDCVRRAHLAAVPWQKTIAPCNLTVSSSTRWTRRFRPGMRRSSSLAYDLIIIDEIGFVDWQKFDRVMWHWDHKGRWPVLLFAGDFEQLTPLMARGTGPTSVHFPLDQPLAQGAPGGAVAPATSDDRGDKLTWSHDGLWGGLVAAWRRASGVPFRYRLQPDYTLDCNLDCKLDCNLDSNLDCSLDSNLDCNLDANLSCNMDCILDSNLDCNLDANLACNLDGNLDSNLDCNWDSKLDCNLDCNLDYNVDCNLDCYLDSNLECNLDSNLERNLDCDLDCNLDCNLDSNLVCNLDQFGLQFGLQPRLQFELQFGFECGLQFGFQSGFQFGLQCGFQFEAELGAQWRPNPAQRASGPVLPVSGRYANKWR